MALVSKDHEKSTGFEPIPEGQYTLEVKQAEWIPTRDGSRNTLKAEFVVARGKKAGRKLWHYFNFESDNETARRISVDHADDMLKAIYGKATEANDVQHFIKLIKGKFFKAKISIQKAEEGSAYSDQNRVVGFVHEVGGDSEAAPAAETSAKPPWEEGDDAPAEEGKKKKKKKDKKKKKEKKEGPWED